MIIPQLGEVYRYVGMRGHAYAVWAGSDGASKVSRALDTDELLLVTDVQGNVATLTTVDRAYFCAHVFSLAMSWFEAVGE